MNLKELSEHLQLSPTTVSRALNGFPEVSEKTRNRVKQAANEFGYAPSSSAKSLATGRSYTIGHVIPQSREEMLNPIFGDFIAGAGGVYARHGYRMLLNVVPDEQEAQTYRDLHKQRTVDGVILHGPHINEPRIDLLNEIGLPYLIHGRAGGTQSEYSYIDVNNRRSFQHGAQYLIGLGHRRIALLNGDINANFAYRRELGYRDGLREAGIDIDPALIKSSEMSMNLGHAAFMKMNAMENPPTAYMCASSVIAMGVHQAITAAGLEIGKDISILTHDDDIKFFYKGTSGLPIYTSMKSSVKQAGEACAKHLIDLIENPNGMHRQELWETELVIGQSTGPAQE